MTALKQAMDELRLEPNPYDGEPLYGMDEWAPFYYCGPPNKAVTFL